MCPVHVENPVYVSSLTRSVVNNNPGGLTLFEGYPDYFIMAINEILFLKALFPRPLHPHDFAGPEAEVTPMPGVGHRTSNGQDTCKQERFSTDLVHAKYALKLRHTSKSINEPA